MLNFSMNKYTGYIDVPYVLVKLTSCQMLGNLDIKIFITECQIYFG